MSSMDQGFVKAFSRRRTADPNRADRATGPVPSNPTSLRPDQAEDKLVFGALELDQSVAETAEIWIDPVEDQIARADQASLEVPRPHVEATHPASRPFGTNEAPNRQLRLDAGEIDRSSPVDHAQDTPPGQSASPVPSEPARHHVDPLQHIHTAYAGAFADPSLMAAATSFEQTFEYLDGANRLEDLASGPSDAASETRVVDAASDAEESKVGEVTEQSVDAATDGEADAVQDDELLESVTASGEAASYMPFQAVWEVDVFDVPTPVADLFFEGALFQQIAERMSDAVSSGLRTVLITSAKPGEGRSSVAIGMAMAAAAAGIRVALVDADTESPSLADELRLDLQYGWVDVIRRGLPIREIAVQAVEDGVTLIPLMPPGVRPAATAFEMVQLLDLLKSNFELIILDGPTSLSPALYQCAPKIDSAVIVRDMTQTDERLVVDLSSRLRNGGVRGVGVVENFV